MPDSRTGPRPPATPKPANRRRGKAALAKGERATLPKAFPEPASNRASRAAERRQAIIDAALDEFIARGFTATRLDDVARRAGVAKGTIYLHFKDKESMFEELIRTALVPLIGRLHAPPPIGGSVRDAVEAFARTRRHARLDRTRSVARRNPAEEFVPLSGDPGGARDHRGDLAKPVQQT